MDVFEDSERVGLVWLRLRLPGLIGEVFEPNDRLGVTLFDPRGVTYADRMSYARTGADNSGVRLPVLCPLLKLARLDETGEGEGDGNKCG